MSIYDGLNEFINRYPPLGIGFEITDGRRHGSSARKPGGNQGVSDALASPFLMLGGQFGGFAKGHSVHPQVVIMDHCVALPFRDGNECGTTA